MRYSIAALPRTRVIIIILLTNEVSTVSIRPVYICNGILHAVKVPFLSLNPILLTYYIRFSSHFTCISILHIDVDTVNM